MLSPRTVMLLTLSSLLAACSFPEENRQLYFGQTQTFGLKVEGTTTNNGVDLIFGWNDSNLAIIPVLTKDTDGKMAVAASSIDCAEKTQTTEYGADGTATKETVLDKPCTKETFSVLGYFGLDLDTERSATPEAGILLGKFFATGMAAINLSQDLGKHGLPSAPQPAATQGTGSDVAAATALPPLVINP